MNETIKQEWVAIELTTRRTVFTPKTKDIDYYIQNGASAKPTLSLSPSLDLIPKPPSGIIMVSLQEQELGDTLVINTMNIATIAVIQSGSKYEKMISQIKASGFGKPKIEVVGSVKSDGK